MNATTTQSDSMKAVHADGDDAFTREEYDAGRESEREVAYLIMARAWIDRWKSLDGSFGLIFKNGEPPQLTRGMLIATDLWAPTDNGREDIPPHTWMMDECDHHGAVRILEGLLELCPGLREAVREIGGREAFARWATAKEA